MKMINMSSDTIGWRTEFERIHRLAIMKTGAEPRALPAGARPAIADAVNAAGASAANRGLPPGLDDAA
jgi:hypothetical protein